VTLVPRVRVGAVAVFDTAAGYGTVVDDHGLEWWFHCTAIEDGSRHIEPGRRVRFALTPGLLGRREAVGIAPD
jgi:cold shock CspA family protein